MIGKLLIANRGEIACRIMRTCRRLNIRTVAVYSDADRQALHVSMADEAVHIGASRPSESYLDATRILDAAAQTGADAIHPGYGFLSENADFAEACEQAGLLFVGPSAETIRKVGSKAAAKAIMADAGVPQVPGYYGQDQSDERLIREAASIGFPLMIKAEAGGGGKGMRIVERAEDFAEQLASTRREAGNAFGDDRVLLERYLSHPRHLEVQVFADHQGQTVHLFERECSSQRRFQKVIEESPAVNLDDAVRERLLQAGVAAARAVDYRNAGTIEFIAEGDGEFYFMEVNARLQVEHPVTECVTGLDLVEWQLRIAAGEPLPLSQDQITRSGHAIEARLYAEDSDHDLLPSTGTLSTLSWPEQVRIDTGVAEGDAITVHYDPMIAKMVVHRDSRAAAVTAMARAVAETTIKGLGNNLRFLYRLINSQPFVTGRMHTAWIDQNLGTLTQASDIDRDALLGVAAVTFALARPVSNDNHNSEDRQSPWSFSDDWQPGEARCSRISLALQDQVDEVQLSRRGKVFEIAIDNRDHCIDDPRLLRDDRGRITALLYGMGHLRQRCDITLDGRMLSIPTDQDLIRIEQLQIDAVADQDHSSSDQVLAPMPGQIIKVLVAEGDQVSRDQPLIIMEAMKMELTLRSPRDGIIAEVTHTDQLFIEADTLLIALQGTDS